MGFRLYAIISNNEAYKEISLKLMSGPPMILMLILLSISTIVAFYNSKKYGRLRVSTEYRTPIVIPYQFNIKDNLIKYLTSNDPASTLAKYKQSFATIVFVSTTGLCGAGSL